jgi:two-component system, chemotaxis family, protein-glutamate methylesterase/glutaminase
MAGIDVVVVGASTGGIEATKALASGLPANFQAAVFIVVHISPSSPGMLPALLNRAGPLPVASAVQGASFERGNIYVAPPDHHMLIEAPDRIRVSRGPKENGFRPAVDPLFRSAALAFGPRVAGVILSGNLDDGTVGLAAIRRRGGLAIVQDPSEASASSMPLSALREVRVDHCVGVAAMALLLANLAGDRKPPRPSSMEMAPVADKLKLEVDIAAHKGTASDVLKLGVPSLFTCPECHGALLQIGEEAPMRFRCHTGHAFTANSLVAALGESTEEALWSTLRALQEKVMLLRHMAAHARATRKASEAAVLLQEARQIQQRARLVRQALLLDDAAPSRNAILRPAAGS